MKGNIIIRCVKSKNWISRIISLVTDSDITHVDVITPDFKYVISSQYFRGVYCEPFYVGREENESFHQLKSSENDTRAFYLALNSQLGRGYDYLAILSILLGKTSHENDKWICSELIAWGLSKLPENPIFFDQPTSTIIPKDIHFIERLEEAYPPSTVFHTGE